MRGTALGVFLGTVVLVFSTGPLGAMVTREEGTKSIAGVLEDGGSDEYTFGAQAGQILFVDLDGAFYSTLGSHSEHEEAVLLEEGGCSDGGGGCTDEGDGCTDDGGGGQFCLQVELDGDVKCWAGRPSPPPGWSLDPRMACVLDESANSYVLRVFRTGEEGDCSTAPDGSPATLEEEANSWPYLLNFSIRDNAPEGRIEPAVGQSQSGF